MSDYCHCEPARRLAWQSAPLFQSVGVVDALIFHFSFFIFISPLSRATVPSPSVGALHEAPAARPLPPPSGELRLRAAGGRISEAAISAAVGKMEQANARTFFRAPQGGRWHPPISREADDGEVVPRRPPLQGPRLPPGRRRKTRAFGTLAGSGTIRGLSRRPDASDGGSRPLPGAYYEPRSSSSCSSSWRLRTGRPSSIMARSAFRRPRSSIPVRSGEPRPPFPG